VVFALTFAVPSAFGAPGAGWIRRFLESTPLRVVALGSFGIYLYHQIAIHYVYEFTGAVQTPFGIAYPHGPNYGFFASLLMTAGATALCAAASYVVVEAPFLRRKHRGSPRGRRPWRTLFSPRPA
jgi:peptidoglycan/LPS O-acetylase OafA/YrhL